MEINSHIHSLITSLNVKKGQKIWTCLMRIHKRVDGFSFKNIFIARS